MHSDHTSPPVTQALSTIMRRIDRCCLWLGTFCLLLMLACISLQIVARYIFDAPPAWTEELGRYAMIWGAMFGATCAYYRRLDPTLSLHPRQLSRREKRFRQAVETSAILVFVGPVLYYAPATIARLASRPTETLEVSTGLVLSVIPGAMAIILFYATVRLLILCLPNEQQASEPLLSEEEKYEYD